MTLLEEIQNAAVDNTIELGTVLRKCKLLASRLGSQPLEDWLIWESNGYPQDVAVPEYRKFPVTIKGNFSGPYRSGGTNMPIPLMLIPQPHRDDISPHHCRDSISVIESLVKAGENQGTLQIPYDGLSLIIGQKIYVNQQCYSAWGELGISVMIEVLNTVRNRILDFSLALSKKNLIVDASPTAQTSSLSPSVVTQTFNTTVLGGIVQQGNTQSTQSINLEINISDAKEAISKLEELINEINISPDTVSEIKADLSTIKSQLSKPTPSKTIIAEAGRSLRSITEGVIAGALTPAFIDATKNLWAAVGLS